jgi:hypothetical protein
VSGRVGRSQVRGQQFSGNPGMGFPIVILLYASGSGLPAQPIGSPTRRPSSLVPVAGQQWLALVIWSFPGGSDWKLPVQQLQISELPQAPCTQGQQRAQCRGRASCSHTLCQGSWLARLGRLVARHPASVTWLHVPNGPVRSQGRGPWGSGPIIMVTEVTQVTL